MENILKRTLVEYEKSAFLIDLVEHQNGRQYIKIIQTITDEEISNKRIIKINPSLLNDILKTLNLYQSLIPNKQIEKTTFISKELNETNKVSIQKRYLKGISIPELAIQFDCEPELIEQILRNSNIEIIKDNSPQKYKRIK